MISFVCLLIYVILFVRYDDDSQLLPRQQTANGAVTIFDTPPSSVSRAILESSRASQQQIDPHLLDEDEDDQEPSQTEMATSSIQMRWRPIYTPNSNGSSHVTPSRRQQPSQNTPLGHSPSTTNPHQQSPSITQIQPSQTAASRFAPQTPAQAQTLSQHPRPAASPSNASDNTQSQTLQVLANLTSVTERLVETCNALKETIGTQNSPDTGMDKRQKATLATEILANTTVDEEVRMAAVDYLKRLFRE